MTARRRHARWTAGLAAVVVALATAEMPTSSPATTAGGRFVVRALGDSIPSGFGLRQSLPAVLRCNRTLPTTACDNPDLAFPTLAARALTRAQRGGRPLDIRNLAIGGAKPSHMVGDGQLVPLVDATVAADPDVVIVMIGANDLLADPPCAARRRCARRLLAASRTTATIRRLLARLTGETRAHVYLTLYYRHSLDADGTTAELNRAVAAAAAGLHRVTVVRPPSFRGHGCFDPPAARWVLKIFQDFCLHPNRRGHRQMARAVLGAIRAQARSR